MGIATTLPVKVVTEALRGVRGRSPGAFDRLWCLVYRWLVHRARTLLARDGMRGSMSAEDLVHDAFLKLKPAHIGLCRDRWHLVRLASRAMRQVLCDRARRRQGTAQCLEAANDVRAGHDARADLLDVGAALAELRTVNAPLADVAELRFFAGLTFAEIGAAMHRSEAWARAITAAADRWLRQRLQG